MDANSLAHSKWRCQYYMGPRKYTIKMTPFTGVIFIVLITVLKFYR